MRTLLKAIAGAALVATALVAGAMFLNRLPWMDEPGMAMRLRTYLTTNVAETSEHSVFPELRSRRYALDPQATLISVRKAVATLGWPVVAESTQPPRLTAVATTPLLRFKDDVTVHVEREAGGSRVRVISRSRVGRGDLGANTRHVMDFHAALDAAVAVDAR